MTELENAARMALEQLEFLNACYPHKTAADTITALTQALATAEPIPIVLHCPKCGMQHIDEAEEERTEQICHGPEVVDEVIVGWDNPPHRSHLCHGCGTIWRPADVPTTGVAAINTKGKADTWAPGPPVTPERKGEPVPLIWQNTLEGRIEYILQDDANTSGTRIVDIAYSAFMSGAVGKNKDDGGKCDWFNDTKPMVMEAIQQIRNDLKKAQKHTSPQVPEGFALVPVEPTPEMKSAGIKVEVYSEVSDSIGVLTWGEVRAIYRAMLDAARKGEKS